MATKQWRERYATIAVLGSLAIVYWWVAISKLLIHTTAVDFHAYYDGAKILRLGLNPYLRITPDTTHDPPAWLLCFGVLTLLPIHQAFIVWNAIHAAALTLSCWLLARQSRYPALFVLAILFFAPVLSNFDLGQSKIEILCLLLLAQFWMERSRDGGAGMVLALAALWRIFPTLMLGYLAVRFKYRAFAWTAGWLAVGTALTITLVGWTRCLGFLTALRSFDQRILIDNENNLCLTAVILRNTGSNVLAIGASLLILALTVGHSFDEERHWRIFALWIATSLLLLPISWPYDLVVLLIPFASLAAAPISPGPLIFTGASYLTASAPTWLFLFGYSLLGVRLTSFLYPLSVHVQWTSPLSAYVATLMSIRFSNGRRGHGDWIKRLTTLKWRTLDSYTVGRAANL